ncbi:MAG: phosphoenolpyruvate--protein phosphotransferase [Spirochaetota bacterium]
MSKRIKKGIVASPGIKIGKAFVFHGSDVKIPMYKINEDAVETELQRFEEALTKTKNEIIEIQNKVSSEEFSDLAEIFSTHIMALEDPMFTGKAREKIKEEKRNAEWIINDLSIELINTLSKIEDEYLKERIIDISDINKRLIGNLQQIVKTVMSDIHEDGIIFAPDITPSETAQLNRNHVMAFVTDHGGKTSHSAIMARSMNIPAIVGMDDITSYVKTGDIVIVDALHGEIIINPSKEEIAEYTKYQKNVQELERDLAKLTNLPARTLDGEEVLLYGNIELPEEVDIIKSHGAQGIGLFRSEFLFLGKELPDEEEQYRQFRKVIDYFSPFPVTIRTLDFGGDKIYSFIKTQIEMNPFLGCRSIRFSLKNPHLFKTQLRAILRASAHGPVQVMFPMISTLEELLIAKDYVKETMSDLEKENIPYDKNIPIGIMVEVPSAVISADLLAPHVDFFSVGTNDLVQYILAVDRGNERVAHLYNPLDISVLRYLKTMANVSKDHSVEISICGEIAGEPNFTMLLLGLGYRNLSMSTKNMYQVKKIIRSVNISECEELASNLMSKTLTTEIEQELYSQMKKRFPDIIF